MHLKLIRTIKSVMWADATIGKFLINNSFFCHSLEDFDRFLTDDMTEEEIKKIKVAGLTAIPTGLYQATKTHSNRFGCMMPLLLNVKGFDGIRIHSGNTAEDTSGCILLGEHTAYNFIKNSKDAFERFMLVFDAALNKGQDVSVEITREYV